MTIFGKIDLIHKYHQTLVYPKDVAKTVISTPFGLWEFLRMLFGFRKAIQSFQRLMNRILQGLPFNSVCIYDVFGASRNPDEHVHHLQRVFDHLRQHDSIIQGSKLALAQRSQQVNLTVS